MAGFILNADVARGQAFGLFGQTVTERITAGDSGSAYYLMEEISRAGRGVPPHTHSHEDEIVQVPEGTCQVFLDLPQRPPRNGPAERALRRPWHHDGSKAGF